MERSSSGQEPTHLPRWEEVAQRKPSERLALRRWGCARSGKGTQFHCLKFRLGSAGEPTIYSLCYSVPYMKIPANNQVITCITPRNFALPTSRILDLFIWRLGHLLFLPFGLKIMKFVSSIFRNNWLAFNHFIISLNSLLMTVDSSCKFFDLQNNVVSSANKTEKRTRDTEAISFM